MKVLGLGNVSLVRNVKYSKIKKVSLPSFSAKEILKPLFMRSVRWYMYIIAAPEGLEEENHKFSTTLATY